MNNDTSALLMSLLKADTPRVRYEEQLLRHLQGSPLVLPRAYWEQHLPPRSFFRLPPPPDRRSRRQRQKEKKRKDSKSHLDAVDTVDTVDTLDFEKWKLSMKIDTARRNGEDVSAALHELSILENQQQQQQQQPPPPLRENVTHNSVDDEFDAFDQFDQFHSLHTPSPLPTTTSRFMSLLSDTQSVQVPPPPPQLPPSPPPQLPPTPPLPFNHPLMQLLQKRKNT